MTSSDIGSARLSTDELTALRPLQSQYPNLDAALAEIARLEAESTLPKGVVHILSDIHGDDVKMRHVINNASGRLRPLIERLFGERLGAADLKEFITLIFYPQETLETLEPKLRDTEQCRIWCRRTLGFLFEIVRYLARSYPLNRVIQVVPVEYHNLLQELLHEPTSAHPPDYYDALVHALVRHGRALAVIRRTVRLVRNLAVDELVIGGDCWDRGQRGDRVVDYLMHQPSLSFVWGNHDAAWLGACLGQEALIAHVLRISLRYRRLSQLEEGYGIPVQPLEHLVRAVYKDDPAKCFIPRGEGLRDKITMARMQKAAAVLQFKLEGQLFAHNPDWGLEHRRLLHTIDKTAGTIRVDGNTYPLRDSYFPTLDPANPYCLSAEEQTCLNRIRQSFLSSQKLWEHLKFLHEHGSMYLVRDDNLLFHGCVPVDEKGEFQELVVDGVPHKGKALFDAFDNVLARLMDRPSDKDRDWCWYLWCGPRSPLFGKDRITTLENDLIADKATHVETKNPYFQLVHDVAFCDRILREFGMDPAPGLIVNGHVPVKIEQGELPLKRSGKAITIDGAFSEAYGDHGYTLVLEPERTLLAKHHHFESVAAAVRDGVDIIPSIEVIRQFDRPRNVADTERGAEIRRSVALLERLAHAYRSNQLDNNIDPGETRMANQLHPSLYQINTRCYLRELGGQATLDSVPDALLDRLRDLGFDWVWFLGVWQTGAKGQAISRSRQDWRREWRRDLPDLREEDITGSPFAVTAYSVNKDFGGDVALARLRERLRKRGLRLLLDFVPNHVGLDHPWTRSQPMFFIPGSEQDLAREPQNYTRIDGGAIMAYGRDPYFDGWPDTLQLNYRHTGLRAAMLQELLRISDRCDGVRCDMAMLILPDIFRRTWGDGSLPRDGAGPADASFWPEAIRCVRRRAPDFLWMAEAYWDLEWALQQQGFDYTYDKRLYDRLRGGRGGPVRGHLQADAGYQRHSVRFLENHDEPRAAAIFPPGQHQAAAVITDLVPGLRFFHEGQFEGRRIHASVHLGRRPAEPVNETLRTFYSRLLEVLKRPEVRTGDWQLFTCRPGWDGNPTSDDFVVFHWENDAGRRLLVIVNYSPAPGQCYAAIPVPALVGKTVRLKDLLGNVAYERHDLPGNGLYLELPPWGHHVFEVVIVPSP